MRFCLALCLTLLCACDKLSDSGSEENKGGETNMQEGAQKIVTTQQTVIVGEQKLAARFPLAPMAGSQIVTVRQVERPGEPIALQMLAESQASMSKVVDHYESEMRARGLKVQSSHSAKDPNQTYLMGDSATASATVLVNRGVGDRPSTVSVTWTDKLVIAPGTSSAPADKK